MIEAVIFDMDGVIVDSEPLWLQAKREAGARFGFTVTEEDGAQTVGLRIDEISQRWVRTKGLDPACADALTDAMIGQVIAQLRQLDEPMAGVRDTLHRLGRTSLKVGLASSSPLRLIDAVLERFGLADHFQVRVSAEHLPLGKPHPQVYLEAAAALGVLPQHCLAIEDSVNGVIAAKAAQMTALCVPEPALYRDQRFGIADFRLPSLADFDCPQLRRLLGL